MQNIKDITYRNIAIMLAKALPIENTEFTIKVNEYLATIKAMSREHKAALKAAYIFSRKVPREEREDLFQELALALLKHKTKDDKLAYAIARCDWKNWWQKYKIRQHYSLDMVTDSDNGDPVTLGETLVGEVEFERKMDGKLDGQRIWQKLPGNIKAIVNKRLIGKALNNTERSQLNRWIKTQGYQLLIA